MTDIQFIPRRENPLTDVEDIVSGGYALFRPAVTLEGAQWVTPVWGSKIMLNGAAVTLKLDPNDTVPYEMFMDIPDGKNGRLQVTEFRFVKTSTSSGAAWQSLEKVTGPTGESLPTGTQAAINADLYAQIAGFSGGGATNLAGITNMSTDARALLVSPNSYSTMRGLLGAAASANPVFTGTVTIPDAALAIADTSGLQTALDAKAPLASPAFTGNPTAPTPSAGDNDTTIATTAFVTALLGSGSVTTNSPTFTGTTDLVNLDVSGTTAFAAGSIAQAAVNGLTTLATTVGTHTTQIAAMNAGIAMIIETSPGVYDGRYITAANQPVGWVGSVAPAIGGTVSSGTTAVNGLDLWFRI